MTFGGHYAWQEYNGPADASAADCKLAQQIIDKAQTPPSDKAQVQKWMDASISCAARR